MHFLKKADIFSEVSVNKQLKIKLLILLWRLSQLRLRNWFYSLLLFPLHLAYWVYSQILLGIELPIGVSCQGPLIIWHGTGLVLNPGVKLGSNVVLRNGVTIGNNGVNQGCPSLGDGVEVGANAAIIGCVNISNHAKIGPNAFVNFDVEEGEKIVSATLRK